MLEKERAEILSELDQHMIDDLGNCEFCSEHVIDKPAFEKIKHF